MKQEKNRVAAAAMTLLVAGSARAALPGQGTTSEKQLTTIQSKFYCHIRALTEDERARHKQLSDKLWARRNAIVETEKGYEFQFSPQNVALAELVDWVVAESKCCPFFDFHIDLENEGQLICLRLTGEQGVKEFIRAEFHIR